MGMGLELGEAFGELVGVGASVGPWLAGGLLVLDGLFLLVVVAWRLKRRWPRSYEAWVTVVAFSALAAWVEWFQWWGFALIVLGIVLWFVFARRASLNSPGEAP